MEQRIVKTLWDAFALFWRGRDIFRTIYQRFQREEKRFRKRMRGDTLRSLYKEIGLEELQKLRDECVAPSAAKLRQAAPHSETTQATALAGNLSVIYHRISLLIEHNIALQEGRGRDTVDDSRAALLRYMEEIHRLIRACERLFEELASSLRYETFFIRSLYLHWQTVSPDRDALRTIYRKMYAGGMVEGLLEVAEDFLRSGFYMRAKEVLEKTRSRLRLIKRQEQRSSLEARLRRLQAEVENALNKTLGGV
ncbi:MAG: hypothetical protein DRP63_00530 [Planctomycetota bacterium]|nr:MAG: hypothetical protein DRP63_00530 [Planctomycetota bacterium]